MQPKESKNSCDSNMNKSSNKMKLKASYVAFMTMFLVLILDQSSLVMAKKKKPNQGGMGGMGGMGGGGMNSRK